ncbi:MAG: twin-arginine translocation pathway signal protein [Planctomycetaceae bacterium]|nr:twin-arginine translocation pathway signal protein [Planctomycetaceae bacterium]
MIARTRQAILLLLGLAFTSAAYADEYQADWSKTVDRVWIGPEFWANRLQDWQIKDGVAQCSQKQARYPMRTLQLLTHRLNDSKGHLAIGVRAGLLDKAAVGPNAAVGVLLGAGGPTMDYRSAAVIHNSAGTGAGIFVGVDGQGRAFIRDFEKPRDVGVQRGLDSGMDVGVLLQDVAVRVLGSTVPADQNKYVLRVSIHNPKNDQLLSKVTREFPLARLTGGIAIVSHPGAAPRTARFGFSEFTVAGGKVTAALDRTAGPILGTQYTLSRNVMKMTAQMMPLGVEDAQQVQLQVMHGDQWREAAVAKTIVPGWTATFRVADWNSSEDTPYRVVYGNASWEGTVRKDPAAKQTIVVAGFTGNHNNRHGLERGSYDWTTSMWFPHHDLTEKVVKHKPDVLFFSGDQVYEGASPTHPDRANIKLDYLYKWYLFVWAYRDLLKDIPAVTIPDDHDIYQGNLWGEGGRKTDKDDKGGYVHPADFVKMSERTQTSHLPDPFDATPLEQGISSYYTDMVYGRISFAVLEDRKFKSGCNGRVPDSGSSRADHITDPEFDVMKADVPGVELLGKRQEEFLEAWGKDWRGSDMKVALSQTVFANVATHHGPALQYLRTDLDSNGWPQSGRNRALDLLRHCYAFHIGGDQHLATIVEQGIDTWGDAGWSFVVPSIANFYPRAFAPKNKGEYVYPKVEDYTGNFRDGLMNYVTVHAATNPGMPMGHEPTSLHDKMPGYGIVKLNKQDRSITMECWPRYADPANPEHKPYPGWPKTITQFDNYGRKASAYLPQVLVEDVANPVIEVIKQDDEELIYTLRIQGNSFRPKVFAEGQYTITVSDPDTGRSKTLSNVMASKEEQPPIRIEL